MALSAGTRLGPYEILAPLGAGGMGEVYRARDSKLQRDVAIKVLPSSLAADPDALARFEREALAVAALSHPNILAIHDFGTHEGTAYAVMELLEGDTLRGRTLAGPISQKQALDYALQIARGLSAAHERGVVHRDLKPENVWLTKDGHIKILDFGLAKRVEPLAKEEETSAPTLSGHTEPGRIMGTVGYMSPEQVRGLAADQRSDIFSCGAILSELLSGKRAFKRDTPSDTMAAILRDEPPELSGSGRDISPTLDHIVRHCLEKDRDSRFQTAKDIAFALSEQSSSSGVSGAQLAAPPTRKSIILIAVAAVVVMAAAGVVLLMRPHRMLVERPGVKRIAVLPFENLGSPEDDYFADGIADEIRSKLTSLPGVEVIARGSSTPYKKTTKTPQQIGHELDVKYLLTATVRWQKGTGAGRVHVTPELVELRESSAPASKWQQPFDAALTDVFQVQSDIATKVAQALNVALGAGEEKRLSAKPTQNLDAYDAYLKGVAILNDKGLGTASLRQALGLFEQAVALDPGFVEAWERISRACAHLYEADPTPQLAERSRQAAETVMALLPDSAEGHVALGFYRLFVRRDPNGALEEYARAQRISPSNADHLAVTAGAEQTLGRMDVALQYLKQAERLDPRSVTIQRRLGEVLAWMRRYVEAREAIGRGLALAPTNLTLIGLKVVTFLGQGDLAGARAVLQTVPKVVEPTALVASVADSWILDTGQRQLLLRLTASAFDDNKGDWGLALAQAYAVEGDAKNVGAYAEEARKAYEERLRAVPDDASAHSNLGLALAYLGRKAEAIREGEHGLALVSGDAVSSPWHREQLARICILVGDQDKALDNIEAFLKVPYYVSPDWLRIDPNFDSLRKNPRFQKLIAGAK